MSDHAAAAREHLLLRLGPIQRALAAAVARQDRLASELARPDARSYCVAADHAALLLRETRELPAWGQAAVLDQDEIEAEGVLRQRTALPLDRMAAAAELDAFEIEAALLCVAPEIDRAFGRLYAYILDDLSRKAPCVELICNLTAANAAERLARRARLGPAGALRRKRLLEPVGDRRGGAQALAPTETLTAFLLGGPEPSFRDPDDTPVTLDELESPALDADALWRAGAALAAGELDAIGIWSPDPGVAAAHVRALAAAAAMPLRRLRTDGDDPAAALATAAQLGALTWLEIDRLEDPEWARRAQPLLERLAGARVPLAISGRGPWRPAVLLAARNYAEITPQRASHETRLAMWNHAAPDLPQDQRVDLAVRFRLSPPALKAAARLAESQDRLSPGKSRGQRIEAACAAIARKRSFRFADIVVPKRGPNDLVLPAPLHRQVMEIPGFYRACFQVDEAWGFGRLLTGEGGVKALFNGDSGTGKTLAAEVIAQVLGLPLVKIDLARVVSKWLGETEKNLEAAFAEAEEAHGALFFDEADALFGVRGEVGRGADRYANLEVAYLLQRLESFSGLAILASNLRDNMDSAFIRRFQVILHFPRPAEAERRRIWEIAFPEPAPRRGVDLDLLAKLDLTGGGIVNAARTAAFLTADAGEPAITMGCVIEAVARQYRRETRILTAADLGPYGSLLNEVRDEIPV